MFIFKVTVVLYFIKILSSSRNFYRLRMTSLTSTNVFTISCLSIEPPPPDPVNLVLQHWCKALQSLYCTIRRLFVAYSRFIRTIRRLFADYSSAIRTIRRLFALFVDYSHYSLHYSSFINCRYIIKDKVEKGNDKVMHKKVMMVKTLFLRLGSSVHHFEHVIKQETHILTKMIIKETRNTFLPKRSHYQIFLKIHEILPKLKLFTKSGHTDPIPELLHHLNYARAVSDFILIYLAFLLWYVK